MPIQYGSDGLVLFVYFYQTFDGGCRGVQVNVLPFDFLWNEYLTIIYCFPDLSLEGFSRVCGCDLQVICL